MTVERSVLRIQVMHDKQSQLEVNLTESVHQEVLYGAMLGANLLVLDRLLCPNRYWFKPALRD